MEKNYQFLRMDINKPINRNLTAIQYDNKSRYILVSVFSNFIPYDLTYTTVKIYGIKGDETVFFNNAKILDAKNGKFEIDLTEQCLAVEGKVEIQILILGPNEERLSSHNFTLNVKKNIIDPVRVTSQEEWGILTEGLSALAEYDVYKNNVARHDNEIKENTDSISILNDKAAKIYENLNSQRINIQAPLGYEHLKCIADANFKGDDGLWYKDKECLHIATDNTANLKELMEISHREGKELYAPQGRYAIENEIIQPIIGLKGENMIYTEFVCNSNCIIDNMFFFKNINRCRISDVQFNANGRSKQCINTSYDKVGPSLNNTFERVFCKGYLELGWLGENNSDVWFRECLIGEPAKSSDTNAIKIISPGGPVQFINCNFLDSSVVSGQYIAFTDCVNRGVVIGGIGFNVFHYTNGYLTPNTDTNLNIEIKNGFEVGPLTFTSPHIEIDGGYLIGGEGKLHYGVNCIGGHIFDTLKRNTGKLLQDTVKSTYAPASLKFENVWFDGILLPTDIYNSTGFMFNFLKSYLNGAPISENFIIGDKAEYSSVSKKEAKLCATQYDDGFYYTRKTFDNVSINGHELIVADKGVYIITLMGTTLDTPKSLYLLAELGGYGNVYTPLLQAPGIASFEGVKLSIRKTGNSFYIYTEGGTNQIIPQVKCYIQKMSI